MIDPTNITNYNRTDTELQAFWIFCLAVQGKNADNAARVISKMLAPHRLNGRTPFQYFTEMGEIGIRNTLVVNRVGQYTRLTRAIMESLIVDLRNCRVHDLEKIFGVGPKTSRFFILHTRPTYRLAVLDVHILNWLRQFHPDAPKSTPTNGAAYRRWETLFLQLSEWSYPGMTPAERDLTIWCEMSGRLEGMPEPVLPGVPEDDLAIEDHGTLWLLTPLTGRGREWVDGNINEGYQSFGNAIVVEHRYIMDIAQGAQNDGLHVRSPWS